MKLVTKQSLANSAASRWQEQYRRHTGEFGIKMRQIGEDLAALGMNPLIEDVDRIIGNKSWTSLLCHECQEEVERVVEWDVDEYNHRLCKECLTKALKLLNG